MRWFALAPVVLIGLISNIGRAEEDVVPLRPFKTGDVIGYEQLGKLKGYLPEPFWKHREYFFFEGMQLRIGPFHADYSPSDLRKQVTERHKGQPHIGRDERGEGWIDFYHAGTPFPEIDPNDPDAGLKIAWNATHRHDAMEGGAHFRLSSWNPGETKFSFAYEGSAWGLRLANRIDKADGDAKYFPDEDRKTGGQLRLTMPTDLRSLAAVGYRYLIADTQPLVGDDSRDVWAWIPSLRRVRRVPGSTEEEQAIPGTEFLIQDIGAFNFVSGLTQKYEFKLVGEAEVLTPIDTTVKAYPLVEFPNLGPSGFSFANDTWQVRDSWILWIRKRIKTPAYSKKLLWIDKQTFMPLYAAAYRRTSGELWRLIYMVHRWSESPAQREVEAACDDRLHLRRPSPLAHPRVGGGERALHPIGHVVVNVLKGRGSRIEAWDGHATHLRDKDIRRKLDSNRLVVGAR
jgi:hypothetical protein